MTSVSQKAADRANARQSIGPKSVRRHRQRVKLGAIFVREIMRQIVRHCPRLSTSSAVGDKPEDPQSCLLADSLEGYWRIHKFSERKNNQDVNVSP
jgi:hypothetical protein